MALEYEETIEFYKNLDISIVGIPKNELPHQANANMSDAELVAFYSEQYVDVDVAEFPTGERRERLFRLCNLVKPAEFYLDVGCANAAHMEILHQRGINGIGLDLSIPNILRGRQRYPHLKFIHGFAEAIPFKDNHFDIVMLGDAIEHFRNPKVILAECLRVARKGLALCVPITSEVTREHINSFSCEEIFNLLKIYKLKVHFYDCEGKKINRAEAESNLKAFPWLLIRAEKTEQTNTAAKGITDTEGAKEHRQAVDQILSNDEWRLNTEHQRDETHLNRFKILSHLIEGQKVLEIGCGNGDLSVEMAKLGFAVVGVDISKLGIQQAVELAKKENLNTKAQFKVMDATSLEFADNSFDTVLIPEVLEHVRDSRRLIEEAIRVVRNGGRIIVSVPNGLLVPFQGHLRVFFKDTLTTELSQHTSEIRWHELPFKKWLVCSFFVRKKELNITDEPLVDIMMPTYNGRKYIRRAIKSVLDQTYQNWNLVVVNDGGEDVKDILDVYQDDRIKYFVTEHKGKAHALNVGITNSNGGFIGYLDDDDILYPIHLELLIKAASKGKKDFVYSDWYVVSFDENEREIGREFEFRQDVAPWMLIRQNYISNNSFLHTRSLLEEAGMYDEELDVIIDWDMIRRLAFISKPYHVWGATSEGLHYYNKTGIENRITGMWTRSPDKARRSMERIVNKTMNLPARTKELKKAVADAMLHRSYYHSLELNDALQAKDTQISNLEANLQEKISHIGNLEAIIRDKGDQISHLEGMVSEKDGEIEKRGAEIKRLKVGLAEGEREIASLNQTLAEHDAQIINLNQAINGRDGQIANLNQAVVVRDGQIAVLYHSTCWRITWPVRIVGDQLKRFRGIHELAMHPPTAQVAEESIRFNRLRNYIYRMGKKIYLSIPQKYHRKILYWAYQNLGFLFRSIPHYENWRNSRAYIQNNAYYQSSLIDINKVQPAHEVLGSIAIHLHIFYHDLVKEFVDYLKNMPFPYDLYVSISSDEAFKICQRAFAGLPFCRNVKIKRVVNRGRDIAPMLCAFGEELAGYDYIAHLHSKKSLYNKGATEGWREYLCNNLLGSEERIRRIFNLMQGAQPCGIVYPQNSNRLSYAANTWLANRELGEVWCARLGISDVPRGYFDFPASSMFWASGDALAPLFSAGITLDDFPEESGQTDGTLAHCLEHLFVLISLKQGMPPGIIKDGGNPSWSAWRFDQYTNRSYESMVQLFSSANIKLIAFDLFDTLFCRPLLDPETIKMIVSRRVRDEAGYLFKEYRVIAERQARDAKGLDVGLDEIYARLGELTGLSEDRLAELRHIEEEVEKASLEPRSEALRLYRDALATGKPVAVITDTFLPRAVIETYLRMYDIEGWDALFVSNEIGLRKDNGKLYEHVLAHYAIEPTEMLMVGDNERSDVQIPGDMGASLLHLLRPVELARGLPRFSSLITSHTRSGNIDAEFTLGMVVRKNFTPIHYPTFDPDSLVHVTPYNLGYSLVGPLLVSFSQWLLQKSREDGVDRLYFLSREGKLIKQVYDFWSEGKKKAPKSDYLVISRRAAGVAAILTLDNIFDIARTNYFSNTIENFLRARYGLSLSNERWGEIARSQGWDRTTVVSVQDRKIEHLGPLLQTLQAEIFAKAQSERLVLLCYLTDKGLNRDDRQAVVDIGYGGSVQGYMNKLLSQKVHGYYLMTNDRAEKVAGTYDVIIRGCFFENVKQSANLPIMYRYSFDLEKLLSSDEPQIEYYERDATGNVKGHYRDLFPAEIEGAGIRKPLQEGAMDYATDTRRIRETMLPDFQPSCWTAKMLMEAFLTQHSQSETDLLSKIVLDDHYCGRGLVS